jgi:hypothetical protein
MWLETHFILTPLTVWSLLAGRGIVCCGHYGILGGAADNTSTLSNEKILSVKKI